MKRIWKCAVLFFLSLCLLVGCGGDENPQDESFSVVNNMRVQIKDEGIFYIDGFTEQMKFYDFQLGQSIPICDRPNCEHDAADCNAYFYQGFMSGMGCYQEKLYYYDNMESGIPFYQCDKNGSNRKVLAKLNEEGLYHNLSVSLPMFFVGDEAIFGMTYFNFLTEPIEQEDGTVISQEDFWMLGKINLKSGEFDIIKKPEKLNDLGAVTIQDYMEGMIFYEIFDGSEGTIRYSYCIETGEETTLFEHTDERNYQYLRPVRSMGKEIYMNQEENIYHIYSVDAQTGETEFMIQREAEAGRELYLTIEGERLLYCAYEIGEGTDTGEDFRAYRFVDGEETMLTPEEYYYAPFIGETDEWYVGWTDDGMSCIRKKDYEKADWSKVQVIGFL